MSAVFIPGWGAPGALYAPLVPPGWSVLDPPSFAASRGALEAYVLWLVRELERRGRSVVGGHSMGGALALLAAARAPALVERLVLVSPAGRPIVKPLRASARDFASQLRVGLYPRRVALGGGLALAAAPYAALRLARRVRALDLGNECLRIRRHGIDILVAGCPGDTLVRAGSARSLALALDGEYVEIDAPGGHMWMLADPTTFSALLTRA
jgi:pimeloyl-ACP methyl ester carboxylesterase